MKKQLNYPIKFEPILKEKIWGGDKLNLLYGKGDSSSLRIGESWELSDVHGNISIVLNGALKGQTIKQLILDYRSEFIGNKVYQLFGDNFPLLFKFIDAAEDLSIQLHPNDKIAKEKHNSFGKTEMWYILEADTDSKIYTGLKNGVNKKDYLSAVKEGKILEVINVDSVNKEDVFFIESGTIHGIGKNTMVAEIQQTSDITYRVYDWGRVNEEGLARELHNDLAIDALDFTKDKSCKVVGVSNKINNPNRLVKNKYFTVNKVNLEDKLEREISKIDSFVVYMCVCGEVELMLNDNIEKIRTGETILIPACVNSVILKTKNEASLLEIYI